MEKQASPYPEPIYRTFKGDKATDIHGSRIPYGTQVRVIKFLRRRRVVVEYLGERILTMLWCLKKEGKSI
jgi:hypothetical protein